MNWKLAEAKNKLSEVVRLAIADGPQRVVRRNDAVVVLAERDYEVITGRKPSFTEFLLDGPELEELDLTRSPAPMRDVVL